MSDTNWELKDRRIGWMNCNTNAAAQIMAMATAGAYKDKDEAYIRKQFVHYRDIDYASFLDLNMGASQQHIIPSEEKNGEPDFSTSSQTQSSPFFGNGSGSPASPKKKKKSNGGSFFCVDCKTSVSDKVKEYSEEHFNEIYCYDCQNKIRNKIEGAESAKDLKI